VAFPSSASVISLEPRPPDCYWTEGQRAKFTMALIEREIGQPFAVGLLLGL